MINDFIFWHDGSRIVGDGLQPEISASDGTTSVRWGDCATLRFSRNGKFDEESFASWRADALSLFAGVLFNKPDLPAELTPPRLDGADGETLATILECYRGCFCGAWVDLRERKAALYVDQLANMPLYYYFDGSLLCFGSSVFSIAEELKTRGKLSAFLPGAYCLTSYAYMLHDFTLFAGVKRVLPGNIVTCDLQSGGISASQYYRIDNEPRPAGEDEIIAEIDRLFAQAVRRQAALNARYGYENLCALSAGLDSRMTAFALGGATGNQLTAFTYSQLLQPDFEIPKAICHDQEWKWIFKSLDGGWDLLRIDEAIEISNGTNYYPWASQLTDFLDCVNLGRFGLVHTGVIGDVVVGTFCDKREGADRYELGDGAYSQKLVCRLREMAPSLELPEYDYETGMMHNRAINGAALGYSLSFNRKAAAFSPFTDVDFFTFCLHVPIEMRSHHNLYYKWVARCHPKAARYAHNGVAIPTVTASVPYKGRSVPIQRIPGLLGNKLKARSSRNSMNPLEWWYESNPVLRKTLDGYYVEHRDALGFDATLQRDVDDLYFGGGSSALEKTMCISLAGSYAQFM